MTRIAITARAYEAIAASTMTFGPTIAFEQDLNAHGQRWVWLEATVVDRLTAMRRHGESYSDVIVRLVGLEGECTR